MPDENGYPTAEEAREDLDRMREEVDRLGQELDELLIWAMATGVTRRQVQATAKVVSGITIFAHTLVSALNPR